MSLVPEEETERTGTWKQTGLCKELVKVIEGIGWKAPTRIQLQAIPQAIQGKDVIGISQTGSGKTASYGLPILHKLLDSKGGTHLRALILCPTRELAQQVADQMNKMGKPIGAKTVCIVGGTNMAEQAIKLSQKPHVVVSTPGRIKDHLENTKGFNLNKLEFFCLDEADKMLEYDYEAELMAIIDMIPKKRQTSLYSATMTTKVDALQKASLKDPIRLEVEAKHRTVETLLQQYVFIPYNQKEVYLVHIMNLLQSTTGSILLFCEACHVVKKLTLILRKLGHKALPLYGAMTQEKRFMSLERFRNGTTKILVCTDVASRGLDVDSVDAVINYAIPQNVKDYIHRVGRTARAGRKGQAISMVTQYDIMQIQKIEELIGLKMVEFPTSDKEVTLLHERVLNAHRSAMAELKEEELEREDTAKELKKEFGGGKDPKEKRDGPVKQDNQLKSKRKANEEKFASMAPKKKKGKRA